MRGKKHLILIRTVSKVRDIIATLYTFIRDEARNVLLPNPGPITDAISIHFWATPGDYPSEVTSDVLVERQGLLSAVGIIHWVRPDGTQRFGASVNNGANSYVFDGAFYPTNEDYFIAMTYSSTAGLKLYQNGQLVIDRPNITGPNQTTGDLLLGGTPIGGYYQGNIDCPTIQNGVTLTQAQVLDIYHQQAHKYAQTLDFANVGFVNGATIQTSNVYEDGVPVVEDGEQVYVGVKDGWIITDSETQQYSGVSFTFPNGFDVTRSHTFFVDLMAYTSSMASIRIIKNGSPFNGAKKDNFTITNTLTTYSVTITPQIFQSLGMTSTDPIRIEVKAGRHVDPNEGAIIAKNARLL